MSSIGVAFLALIVALIMDRMVQGASRRRMAAREQQFRFRGIRGELQWLAVKGTISPDSRAYWTLMTYAEAAIAHAQPERIHHLEGFLRDLPGRDAGDLLNETEKELRTSPPEVQALAVDLFTELARMLIANDWVVRAGVATARRLAAGWNRLAPAMELMREVMDRLVPGRSRAVEYFFQYSEAARRLAAC